jgi:transcriptional regulator with XRE-family HTH domain
MYGDTIRSLREQKGMTQVQLAELLGVKQTAIANMESGLVQFSSVDRLRQIAAALDVSIEDMIPPDSQDPKPA